MEKRIIQPDGVPQPMSSYSQGVEVKANRLLFLSGQVPCDADGNVVAKGDVEGQARQVFENLKLMLAEAGATFDDVVKLTIFLTNIDDYRKVTSVRSEYLKRDFPASTLVEVTRLVDKDWLLEIEAIAALG